MESTPIPSLEQVPDPQSSSLLIYTVVGGVPSRAAVAFTLMATLTASAITERPASRVACAGGPRSRALTEVGNLPWTWAAPSHGLGF